MMRFKVITVSVDDVLSATNNRPYRMQFDDYKCLVNKDYIVFATGETLVRGGWHERDDYRYHADGRLQVRIPVAENERGN